LTLLEELRKSKLDFIFKGGTALMFMFNKPGRLSIDIDIILHPEIHNLEEIFSEIVENSNFIRCELQNRSNKTGIEKAYYKFFYNPTHKTHSGEEYILLDILFEQNPYNKLIETEINSYFLKLKDEPLKVFTPSFDDILGDKLTAFAPKTTGVPFFKGEHSMSMEIVKQLYDIESLFDAFSDIFGSKFCLCKNGTR